MKNFAVLLLVFSSLNARASLQPLDPPEEMATVHVYRPQKLIGFGWVFNLKVNGKNYEKIKNGKHLVLSLKPGKTVFGVKSKQIELELEAGKTYYLRSSISAGFIIGSLDLVEVTESYAQRELDK